jgi:hypothetical protein
MAAVAACPCPNCDAPLHLTPALNGRTIRCRTCGSAIAVAVSAATGGEPPAAVVRLLGKAEPCPCCGHPFRLVPRLNGRRIRCKQCRATLQVGIKPWRLSLLRSATAAAPWSGTSPTTVSEKPRSQPIAAPQDKSPDGQADAKSEAQQEAEYLQYLRPEQKPADFQPAGDESDDLQPRLPDGEPQPRRSLTATASVSGASSADTAVAELEEVEEAAQCEAAPLARNRPMPTPEDVAHHRWAHGSSTRGSLLQIAAGAGVAVSIAIVVAVSGWWLLSLFSRVPPQVQYLPNLPDPIVSLKWPDIVRCGYAAAPSHLPGLELVERCKVFIHSAGINNDDLQRVNSARSDGSGATAVVYYLNRAVRPEDVANQPPFRLLKPEKETVRGADFYAFERTGIGFPEEKIIVNGDCELVRTLLETRRRKLQPTLDSVLKSLDFSATCTRITSGIPASLQQSHLKNHAEAAGGVRWTVDTYNYAAAARLDRVLICADDATARSVEGSLKASLDKAAAASESDEATRALIAAVHVDVSDGKVRVRLTANVNDLSAPALALLNQLF